MSERRRYIRVDARVITWYRVGGASAPEVYGALTKNLSAGGLLFETDEAVPPGAHIEVELKVPGSPKVLRLAGRSVRLEAVGGGRYDVGVAFESMPPADRATIETYIKGFG